MMFQSVSCYSLKAFELNINKYQLMKEDLSKKVSANIVAAFWLLNKTEVEHHHLKYLIREEI